MKSLKLTVFSLFCLVIALLTGCVSNKSLPRAVFSDNYTALETKSQRQYPGGNRMLTIDEVVNTSLANNPTYEIARLNMIQAYSNYYKSISELSPAVALGTGASNQGTGRGGGAAVGASMSKLFNVLNKHAEAEGQKYAYKNVRRMLIEETMLTYYQIQLDRAKTQIELGNRIYNDQMIKYAESKKNNSIPKGDLLNFKIAKNNAQTALIYNKALEQINKYKLAKLMGLTTANIPFNMKLSPINVSDSKNEYPMSEDYYLDQAIKLRPDLETQKEILKAAKYSLYKSWAALSPTANAGLDYGFTRSFNPSPSSAGIMIVPQNFDWNYGFDTNWNLLQGGSRIFTIREKQAAYYAMKEALLKKWISVLNSVRTNYTQLNKSIARRKITAETLKMAEERRDLLRKKYNEGKTNIAVLNQAQNNLIATEGEYVKSCIHVAMAKTKLAAAVGDIKH
ncbi:MAG TPA: TolC family protein [Victivallales bacterium]|nr:TolC family protein [Victivallales bacterium]